MKRVYNFLIYIMLFVPPLIFFTDLTRNPYLFQIVLVNSLTVLVFLLWVYQGMKAGRLVLKRTPFDLQLSAFLVIATLSWAAMLIENLHEPYLSYGIFSEGLKNWLFLIVNAILVYYIPSYFSDDGTRRKFMLAVFWAGWLASVYGILQYFGIEYFWPRVLNPFGGRSVSTFGNPNFLSSYLVLLIPPAYVLFVKAESFFKRAFYLVFLMTYFSALLCTLTRSSWVGCAASMGIVMLFFYKYEKAELLKNFKKFVVLPFGLMVLFMLFWPKSSISGYNPGVIGRLAESVSKKEGYYGAWDQRKLIWSCAWHMVDERPVLGKGWGCFELFYPFYQGRHLFLPEYIGFRTHANNCHNEILEIWSQVGTVGFGIYLWLLASVVGFSLFMIKNLTGDKKLLAAGLFASLVGLWFDNLLNVSLHFAIPAFLYWWNMGLLVSLSKQEEKTVEIRSAASKVLVWVLLIAGCFVILRYTRSFLGEVHYFSGFKLSKKNMVQAAIPELELAHSYQRFEVNNNYELANCYARSGNREKAIWGYKESLRANAGYDEIYFNMATVLAQTGKMSDAVDEYSRSLYINPLSLEAYNALGSVFLQDQSLYQSAALKMFAQCAMLFPDNKDVQNNLGYLYTKMGKDEEALKAYRKALEIDPDFEVARKNLRISLAKEGTTDKVLEESDALMKAVENSVQTKNWQAAYNNCKRLLVLEPRSFKARLYMANILFTVGRVGEAINEYNEALKLSPSNVSAAANLGLAYFENKQYGPAKDLLEQVLKAEPNNQLLKQKLDQINSLLNPPQKTAY